MPARWAGLLLILVASNAADAQAVDCQRLLKTTVPYELHISQERFFAAKPSQTNATVRQIYRGTGNLNISYTKQSASIFRAINYGPFMTELILDGTRVISTSEYTGIDIRSPPPFDKNHSYTRIMKSASGGREQLTVNVTYRGKKTITVGGCSIPVTSTYVEHRSADGTLRSTAEVDYSPDLRDVLYSSTMDTKSGFVTVFTAKEVRMEFAPLEQK